MDNDSPSRVEELLKRSSDPVRIVSLYNDISGMYEVTIEGHCHRWASGCGKSLADATTHALDAWEIPKT